MAPVDRHLARSSKSFRGSGAGILLVGLAIVVLGGVIALIGALTSETLTGIGAMIATLGVVALIVGVALLAIAAVSNRLAQRKPFA